MPTGINWDETAVSGLIETGGAFVNCFLGLLPKKHGKLYLITLDR